LRPGPMKTSKRPEFAPRFPCSGRLLVFLPAFVFVRAVVLVLRDPQYRYRKIVRADDRAQVRPLVAAKGVALLGTALFAQRDLLFAECRLSVGVIPLTGTYILAI